MATTIPFESLSVKLIAPNTNAPLPVFDPIKFVVNDKEVTKIIVLPVPRRIPVTMAVTYEL